jgi:hypothetical protein
MTSAALSELMYLPPIEFFVAVSGFERLAFDPSAPYQKQTYRNRARILLANKVDTLTVPVHSGRKKMPYKDMRIDYTQKWKNVHLRGIQSAYGKAPFFEYFFPYFDQVYRKNLTFLFDMNIELLTVCLKLLRLKSRLDLVKTSDIRPLSVNISGIIATKEEFAVRDIMSPQKYPQMFGLDFVPNLSILDLLFCMGPESKEVLLQSKKNH